MSQEGKKTSPLNLWTMEDFDVWIKGEKETDLKITIGGISALLLGPVLVVLAGYIIGTKDHPLYIPVVFIGTAMVFLGFYIGIYRHIESFMNRPVSLDFEGTKKFLPWHREVICTSCNHKATISIGFFEYECADCKKKNRRIFGFARMFETQTHKEIPLTKMKKGDECWSCKRAFDPLALTAQFTCPSCKEVINIADTTLMVIEGFRLPDQPTLFEDEVKNIISPKKAPSPVPVKKIPTGHRDWIACSYCGTKQHQSSGTCNNCGSAFKK